MWEEGIIAIINKVQARKGADWFSSPVDFEALGLIDYPQIVKKPMDLKTVREKIERHDYQTKQECAADIRCVWSNAMTYNSIGSSVYCAAKNMSDFFESLYIPDSEKDYLPSATELVSFVDSSSKLSAEELGKVLILLDKICPRSLSKKQSNEVEVNTDLLTGFAYSEASKLIASFLVSDITKKSTTKNKMEADKDKVIKRPKLS